MAVYDLPPQAQLDPLKRWWGLYARWVVGGCILMLIALGTWFGWRIYQARHLLQAGQAFEAFTSALNEKRRDAQYRAKMRLLQDYPTTGYAARAALLSANAAFVAADFKTSEADLQWVIAHAAEIPLQDIARLRLATIYLDMKRVAEGLKRIEAITLKPLLGRAYEVKGDLLMTAVQPLKAQQAYRQSIEQLNKADPLSGVVQLKYDALGGKS